MKRETLTLANIVQDLKSVANIQLRNNVDWRFYYIAPFTALSVALGLTFKNVWIGLLIFSVAAYHIVCFIIDCRNHNRKKKSIMEVVDRADISISIEKLSHIATETIYEPYDFGDRRRSPLKTAKHFYFASGSKWRLPCMYIRTSWGRIINVFKHYPWSKEYHLSAEGLENISVEGNEFYFVVLQENYDISYIYPCKLFVLDETLRTKI